MTLVATLRDGRWLTAERLRAYPRLLLALYAAVVLVGLASATGPIDPFGRPLGTDFSSVWTAGASALAGRATEPYDPALHAAAERASFGPAAPFYSWHYPPLLFLLAVPLALLPYVAALFLWQVSTGALYASVMPRILPGTLTVPVALAFPAVFVTATHGQNGFLTAGLLGWGLLLLGRRPALAGALLALLAYKPQLGLLIPVALLAGRHWTAIASACVTLAVAVLLTLAAFGPESWLAFRDGLAFTREVVLVQNAVGWEKMVTAFAAVRAWGGGVEAGLAAQGVLTVATLAAVASLWAGRTDARLKAAALAAGTLLTTPYAADYDTIVLGPAIAFTASYGLERGFRPWERSALAFAWVAPILTRPVAGLAGVPLGLLATLCLFAVVVRRAVGDRAARPAPA